MKLDYQDSLVIEDAARMLKSQFIDLYTRLGYQRDHVGVAWHELRVTDKGRRLLTKYSLSGGQPTRFYNVEEEVKHRKNNMKSSQLTKPVKKIAPVEEEEREVVLLDNDNDVIKFGVDVGLGKDETVITKVPGRKKDGSKEATAKSLIESGVTKAKELAEKGGFSLPYAYNMLKKYGK